MHQESVSVSMLKYDIYASSSFSSSSLPGKVGMPAVGTYVVELKCDGIT